MVIEVLSTNKNQLPACDRNMPNTYMSKGRVGMSFKKKKKGLFPHLFQPQFLTCGKHELARLKKKKRGQGFDLVTFHQI